MTPFCIVPPSVISDNFVYVVSSLISTIANLSNAIEATLSGVMSDNYDSKCNIGVCCFLERHWCLLFSLQGVRIFGRATVLQVLSLQLLILYLELLHFLSLKLLIVHLQLYGVVEKLISNQNDRSQVEKLIANQKISDGRIGEDVEMI